MTKPSAASVGRPVVPPWKPEDLQFLKPEERELFSTLTSQQRQTNGKLRRLQTIAVLRRFLSAEKVARYEELMSEKARIEQRLKVRGDGVALEALSAAPGAGLHPAERDPDIRRLREIGHEFNGLLAMAYLKAVVDEPTRSTNEPWRHSA